MKSIHPPVPYFKSVKSQFSSLIWQWGVATYFIENIPFEYSTSRLFADQLTDFYIKTLPQDKSALSHQHLYEFGAGMGMLAKHVIEALQAKTNSQKLPPFTLHVSEYSQAQIEDINRYGFLTDLREYAQLDLISALDPQFSIGTPNWIYLSYLVAALPARQICVQDGVIYERYVGAELPDDALITNATQFPPKVLNSEEIVALIKSDDHSQLHPLIPIIAPLIKETDNLIPLDQLTDYTDEEKEILINFVSQQVPKEGMYLFNYPYQWLKAMQTMIQNLAEEGTIVIHDFGFTQLEKNLNWTRLFGKFGTSQYTSVCFPLLEWAATRLGATVKLTSQPAGHSQMMVIYKGNNPKKIEDAFDTVWTPAALSPRSHEIVEEIWSTNTKKPIEVTPEIAKKWHHDLSPVEKNGYSVNAHIASALYHNDHYDEAIDYATQALTDYENVGLSALVVIARSYLKKSDLENARLYFEKMTHISPTYPISYCELAKIELQKNNPYGYIHYSKKWIANDYYPMSWPLLLNLAISAYQIADYTLANQCIDAVIAAYNKAPDLIQDANKSKARLIQKAVKSISFVDAKENLELMTPLTDHITKLWKELQGADGIEKTLRDRKEDIISGKNKGIILLDGHTPVGLAWIESVGLHYGNIAFHTTHSEYEPHLAKAAIDAGMFSNHWLHELVRFKAETKYREAMEYFGIQACTRDRMVIYLDQYHPMEINEDRIQFKPMTLDDLPIVSEMAYLAHQVSQDQHLAYDMATREGRVELDKALFQGLFGNPLPEAINIIYLDGIPAGYYSVVDVKCWGFEHVAWIFDIGVDPKYQGMGLGKILMAHMLNTIKQDSRFELVGLAVTQNNTNAIHIYNQFGFQKIGEFDEFGYAI